MRLNSVRGLRTTKRKVDGLTLCQKVISTPRGRRSKCWVDGDDNITICHYRVTSAEVALNQYITDLRAEGVLESTDDNFDC